MENKTSADIFASIISAQVQKFLKDKETKKTKKPTTGVVKSGALDNELAARAKKLTQTTRERIDAYALWPEVSKVMWVGSQSCTCCGHETTFIGGVFVIVQDPKNPATRIYLRREAQNPNLPTKVEYDTVSQQIPFCVECINEITRPIDDELIHAMMVEATQPSLF